MRSLGSQGLFADHSVFQKKSGFPSAWEAQLGSSHWPGLEAGCAPQVTSSWRPMAAPALAPELPGSHSFPSLDVY